jgi:hypothetical protein
MGDQFQPEPNATEALTVAICAEKDWANLVALQFHFKKGCEPG